MLSIAALLSLLLFHLSDVIVWGSYDRPRVGYSVAFIGRAAGPRDI